MLDKPKQAQEGTQQRPSLPKVPHRMPQQRQGPLLLQDARIHRIQILQRRIQRNLQTARAKQKELKCER